MDSVDRGRVGKRPCFNRTDMCRHRLCGPIRIPGAQGIKDRLMFSNGEVGVSDPDSGEKLKPLQLPAQCVVGGQQELVAGLAGNELV